MLIKILSSKGSGKERLKKTLLYYSKLKGAKKSWENRHGILNKKHPYYFKLAGKAVEEKHIENWSFFTGKVPLTTLRICANISGNENSDIVPEEVFQADIEPTLNRHSEGHIFANKSLYDHWFGCNTFPKTLLHSIDGELMDYELNHLSEREAADLLKSFGYPLLYKPNVNTSGGEGVVILEHSDDLEALISSEQNFVVQEKLKQHPELGKYNPESINTVRVYLYKSITDNRTHILNIAQRMGNETIIDNVSAGGLVSYVTNEGNLHGYALDKYGGKFDKHPQSGITFDSCLPDFDELKALALRVAQKLFRIRVVGLDLFYDHTGCWRALEINTKGHSIRFAQYAGHPFFGEFTNEVVEYCKKHHWALTD